MPALSSHINVWNTCLRILRRRGYRLWLESDDPNADVADCFWCCEKNGYELWADNPIELLGLAEVYEFNNPVEPPREYWWVVDGEDIYDELINAKFPNEEN